MYNAKNLLTALILCGIMYSSKGKRGINFMEMIRIYNDHTSEILEKTFTDPIDADNYEFLLDFLEARYERFHNGKKLY